MGEANQMSIKAVSIITSVAMLCFGILVVPQQSQAAPPTFTLTVHIVYTSIESDGLPETCEFTTTGVQIDGLKNIGLLLNAANNPNNPAYDDIQEVFTSVIFLETDESDIDILAVSISVTPER
jgi:hypothetical protein